MNNQSIEKIDSAEQSSKSDDCTPRSSGAGLLNRQGHSCVVIFAAPGTPVTISGTEAYTRVELWVKSSE